MKRLALLVVFLAISAVPALAGDPAESNPTPVTDCQKLPPSASIEVLSNADTRGVCREMIRILDKVTVGDIVVFSKAAFVLSQGGYKEGQYQQITAELVDILRLRGLYDQEARWYATLDLICKVWQAENGIIGPEQIQALLKAARPRVAKSLSDDGLLDMIILMKLRHQHGDD